MPVHVVKDHTASAGQQAPTPAPSPEKEKAGTSPIFWLVLGVVGGAVAMHFTARKMQEYAGGMYTARARLQSRLGMPITGGVQAVPVASIEEDDEPQGWFG